MKVCIECSRELPLADFTGRCPACMDCCHEVFLAGPGQDRGKAGQPAKDPKDRKGHVKVAKPPLTDEEIERYRRDLKIIPGPESRKNVRVK